MTFLCQDDDSCIRLLLLLAFRVYVCVCVCVCLVYQAIPAQNFFKWPHTNSANECWITYCSRSCCDGSGGLILTSFPQFYYYSKQHQQRLVQTVTKDQANVFSMRSDITTPPYGSRSVAI